MSDENRFLSCKRDIDLERNLSQFLSDPARKLPFIFRISTWGEEVKGNVVITHMSSHYNPDWIVAVSESGTTYLNRYSHYGK